MSDWLASSLGAIAVVAVGFALFGRYREPWLGPLCFSVAMVLLGVVYLGIDAQLVGVMQIFLYGGVPAALLMCVTAILPHPVSEASFKRTRQVRRLVAAAVLGALAFSIATLPTDRVAALGLPGGYGDFAGIGLPLFTTYLIPLEVAGLLMLAAALSAAVFLRRPER